MTPYEALRRLGAMRPELSVRQACVLVKTVDADLRDGKNTVRGLAAKLRYSKPCVSRALDRLAASGLVRRVPDPADRRSVFAVPTAAGRKFVDRLGAS